MFSTLTRGSILGLSDALAAQYDCVGALVFQSWLVARLDLDSGFGSTSDVQSAGEFICV